MLRIMTAAIAVCLSAAPLFAGALVLEVGNPKANAEASAKNAVVVARITACKSPEKTTVTATAESISGGKRVSIPLKVANLSTPGTFAVTREWPKEGTWAIVLVATNPDYKDYATSVLVPVRNDSFSWATVKHVFHRPTAEDIDAALAHNGL
ncbi:MAG: hypothetical protein QOJ99_4899 [Bryobacterales bacterium]|jgi:hypothetical protein|nr:hypothetical protein [Bryobacterales bacterium]